MKLKVAADVIAEPARDDELCYLLFSCPVATTPDLLSSFAYDGNVRISLARMIDESGIELAIGEQEIQVGLRSLAVKLTNSSLVLEFDPDDLQELRGISCIEIGLPTGDDVKASVRSALSLLLGDPSRSTYRLET